MGECVGVNGPCHDAVPWLVAEDSSCIAAWTCLSHHLCVRVRTALPVRVRRAACARSRGCTCLLLPACFQALTGFGAGLRSIPESRPADRASEDGCCWVFVCVCWGLLQAQGSKSLCLVEPGTWSWKSELGLLQSQRNGGFQFGLS